MINDKHHEGPYASNINESNGQGVFYSSLKVEHEVHFRKEVNDSNRAALAALIANNQELRPEDRPRYANVLLKYGKNLSFDKGSVHETLEVAALDFLTKSRPGFPNRAKDRRAALKEYISLSRVPSTSDVTESVQTSLPALPLTQGGGLDWPDVETLGDSLTAPLLPPQNLEPDDAQLDEAAIRRLAVSPSSSSSSLSSSSSNAALLPLQNLRSDDPQFEGHGVNTGTGRKFSRFFRR